MWASRDQFAGVTHESVHLNRSVIPTRVILREWGTGPNGVIEGLMIEGLKD